MAWVEAWELGTSVLMVSLSDSDIYKRKLTSVPILVLRLSGTLWVAHLRY